MPLNSDTPSSTNETLDITVIMPLYNAAPYVADALRSVLQFAEVVEVLVIDDGSTDNGSSICASMADTDPRIRLLRHSDGGNHGASATRNVGLHSARSGYIAFLDADDRYLPERFDAERRIFAEHPDADGVYGALGVLFHSPAAKDLFHAIFTSTITTVREVVPPEELLAALSSKRSFGHFSLDTLTLKRSVLDRLSYLFAPELRLHQDSEFITRLAFHARLYAGSIEKPVAVRGVHEANRITTNRNVAHSNHLLYRSLCAWADTETIPDPIREYLRIKYLQWRIRDMRGGLLEKVRMARALYPYRRLLGQYELANTYFASITGKDTRATRLLIKAAHRVYGEEV